ncbi:hypothetical protein PTKIN_Ptkin14bG0033700 [Pterospermum kingtungense]
MALDAYLQAFSTALSYTGSILISIPIGVYVGKRLVLARYELEAGKTRTGCKELDQVELERHGRRIQQLHQAKVPKGLLRLLSLLPIIYLLFTLPFSLSTVHFCGFTIFCLTWLANFKLLLFSFDQGPLSPPPPKLPHFVSIACLPIKIIQDKTPPQNEFPNARSSLAKPIYAICTKIYGSYFVLSPQSNEPYLSTSLQDFWGRRWNLMVTRILHPAVYDPIRRISTRILGPKWASLPAVLGAFVVSGLMHELIFYHLTRVYPTWEVTWFFILHGVCVAIEVGLKKANTTDRWRLSPTVSVPLTVGFVVVIGFWLFFAQMVRDGTIGNFNCVPDTAINVFKELPVTKH